MKRTSKLCSPAKVIVLLLCASACTEVRDVAFDPNRDPTKPIGPMPPPPPPAPGPLDPCAQDQHAAGCQQQPPTCQTNPALPECKKPLPATASCVPVGDAYPDNNVKPQSGSTNTYNWGEGGGCIHRNIREIWAVANNQPLMVWNKISESHFEFVVPPPGATHRYNVKYIVHDFITVDWDMVWTHAFAGGNFAAPKRVVLNYQRVAGTSHVAYWEGSIILDYLTDGVTSFWMRNQVKASRQGPADAAITVSDVYGKLRTGAPDWLALDRGRP